MNSVKDTSWVGGHGEDTSPVCLHFHFVFQIMGLPNEGLDLVPRPSVINTGAMFCSRIVSFVSLIFLLEVINSLGLGLLYAFFV